MDDEPMGLHLHLRKTGKENVLIINSVRELGTSANPPGISQVISIPLTSYTWLEVEEANFTVTTIPSGHMTEAQAISCLRVALIYMPRGSSRIAAAR